MSDIDEIDGESPETVEVPETTPEQTPKREWSDDDEAEAKAFGWKAPEEWAGPIPAGYIDDPRRYLERAENFRPFKALREKSEQERREYDDRFRKLEAMNERALEQQREQHKRDVAAIQAAQRQAVEMADTARYDQLERQKAALRAPDVIQAAPAVAKAPPEVEAYVQANEWAQDPALREEGRIAIDAAMRSGKAFNSSGEQLQYAESVMRRKYPHLFAAPAAVTEPKPAMVNRVDGGGLGGAIKSGAFTKLPAEAKSAFKKFVSQGLFQDNDTDRKRYADDYDAA